MVPWTMHPFPRCPKLAREGSSLTCAYSSKGGGWDHQKLTFSLPISFYFLFFWHFFHCQGKDGISTQPTNYILQYFTSVLFAHFYHFGTKSCLLKKNENKDNVSSESIVGLGTVHGAKKMYGKRLRDINIKSFRLKSPSHKWIYQRAWSSSVLGHFRVERAS